MDTQTPTREQWLQQCITTILRPMFSARGVQLPDKLRVSCGWPSTKARSAKHRTLGECWPIQASADGAVEVFVSPNISDPVEVAGTLLHELIHSVHPDSGHKGAFRRLALSLGLVGRMTCTQVGEELRDHLKTSLAQLGPYEHAVLDPEYSSQKTQTTRQRLMMCTAEDCGCLIRATAKWIRCGTFRCPLCGTEMMQKHSTKEM